MADEASAAMAGLAKLESYLKRAVQRRDLVNDNKEQLRQLLNIYDDAIRELERLSASRLHDDDNENTTIRQRLETHKATLLANRHELESLQPTVQRSHFWKNRVRRHRQILEKCMDDVYSYGQFYDTVVRPSRERYADIERERKRHKDLDEQTAQATSLQGTKLEPDSYVARRIVPPNPRRLTLNYSTNDTYEGKLKAEILDSLKGGNKIVGVVARGLGGVGKTCALRGLADDNEIRQKFPGGILYIQLGNDSHLSDVISGIAKCVQQTGGKRLAETIRSLTTVQEASETAGQWFTAHRCLFLVDDVWEVNGITACELRKLGSMLNDVSLLVYTSRASEIDESVDKTVVFTEREVYGELSRSMLMNHADIGSYEDLSAANREAVEGILEICQGLPLAFGIAGATAWGYCKHGGNRQDAWSEYYHDLKANKQCIASGETAQYGSLWLIVDRSLKALESRPSKGRNFTEKFRKLCVLQKQQSVGGQMLQKLWSMESLRQARELAEMFESVSLIRMTKIRENQFTISVHDLIIDVATQMNSESERIGCFRTLADNYVPQGQSGSSEDEVDTRGDKNSVLTRWWSVADDGFLHNNLCRVLKEAHREIELLWLLERARWVVMRLQTSGLAKVEQDLRQGMTVAESYKGKKKDAVSFLKNVNNAVRASWFAVDEIWFQLYGRLVWYSEGCERTRNFLAEIEEHAPRPWVKPSVGVLPQAGGMYSESVRVAAEHGDVIGLCGAGAVIHIVQKKGVVTEYDRTWGTEKNYTLSKSGEIRDGAWSDDGKRLVTVDNRGEVVLWNCASGYHLEKHVACSDDIECVGISGNGQTVAYWSKEAVFVVDANGETHSKTLDATFVPSGMKFYRGDIDVSFTGKRIVIGLYEGRSEFMSSVHVWDRESDEVKTVPSEMQNSDVMCIAISKDGKRVVCGSKDGSIQIWDVEGAEGVVRTCKGHRFEVNAIDGSADGKRIVSTEYFGRVCVWDAENGVMIGRALKTGDRVSAIALSQDGKEALVSDDMEKVVRVLDMERMEVGDVAEDDEGRVECVAYCGHGKKIVGGCDDGRIRVWDADRGAIIGRPLEAHAKRVTGVAVSVDGSRIVSASWDKSIRVLDANSRRAVAQRRLSEDIWDVAVNCDGTHVAYCCENGTVEVWHVHSDTVTTVTRAATSYTCVAMSADGARVAFESQNDHTVVVCDVDKQRGFTSSLEGHTWWISSLAFSADGTRVVSASLDHTVRVWDVATGEAVCEPFHHDRVVRRVWDVATGEAIGQPFHHHNEVYHVQSHRHGSHVVSYDREGYGRLWHVNSGQCVITSSHPDWAPTLHRFGVAAFAWHFPSSTHGTIVGRADAGYDNVLATLDKNMFRVGDVYYSSTYTPNVLPSCRIVQ